MTSHLNTRRLEKSKKFRIFNSHRRKLRPVFEEPGYPLSIDFNGVYNPVADLCPERTVRYRYGSADHNVRNHRPQDDKRNYQKEKMVVGKL